MTQSFLSVYEAEQLSHIDLKIWVKFLFCQWFIFFDQMTQFFSRGTKRKIESFWLKDLGQILVPPVIHFFRSKWLIFSLGARSEKIESFWLKNLGQMLVPPVILFLGQNDSFFLLVHEAKKLSHFDLKIWVKF